MKEKEIMTLQGLLRIVRRVVLGGILIVILLLLQNSFFGTAISGPIYRFTVQYYNNRYLSGSPTFTWFDTYINSDWGWSSGPGNGIGNDNFSVRWTNQPFAPIDSRVDFYARADDGVRMFLDGTKVLDGWRDQPATVYRLNASRNVKRGSHSFKVEYYENGGAAAIQAVARLSESYNSAPVGQCTRFAKDRMFDVTGSWIPAIGNAGEWRLKAPQYWWSVGTAPEVSSVIIMQYGLTPYSNAFQYWYWLPETGWRQTSIDPVGHVGWVDSISCDGTCVHVRDQNWTGKGEIGDRWIYLPGAPIDFIYSSH